MVSTTEQRAFIDEVREQNARDFGPTARRAVQKLLSAGAPHPWMYVYELTQNARDAGAKRVRWQTRDGGVVLQHDGDVALDPSHVRGIASLGASTKGLSAIGFMGVGFKSVFARFRVARVSGSGWRFRFEVGTEYGDLDASVPKWFDTLQPQWDEAAPEPEPGFTTAFVLEDSTDSRRPVDEDLARIASPDDPTPLAVLALRGLEQVQIGTQIWDLRVEDGFVEVRSSNHEAVWRWRAFRSRYRPDDDAMRRFLEVRQELQDDLDAKGQRLMREVVALLPLGPDDLPQPPEHGHVYATLPTQVPVPFGFHLQADWLVNVDRQNLREVSGDPWQHAIVRQVPELVRQLFVWLAEQPELARRRGYEAMRDPSRDDGLLSEPFEALRDEFAISLSGIPIVPIHGSGERAFRPPAGVARLPGRFLDSFGKTPTWHPEILFGRDLMDEAALGARATEFADWLGWGDDLNLTDLDWPATLPAWWERLDEDARLEALFALWDGAAERQWHEAAIVPTEAGNWVAARATLWLNEEPPSEKEPSGRVIAEALETILPGPGARIPAGVRQRASRTQSPGVRWLKVHHREVILATLVDEACSAATLTSSFPLVELVEWALSRGDNRQDLVPLVLTETGAREPSESLLADPIVEGGSTRRALFRDVPALVENYALIEAPQRAVVLFLERLGVRGSGELVETVDQQSRWDQKRVANLLEIPEPSVKVANDSGYRVVDRSFPFDVWSAPPVALQDWLSREHVALRGKGRRIAHSRFYGEQLTQGQAAATWVRDLRDLPWLLCTDDLRRKPSDVLLAPDPAFESAPIANIDAGLATRLREEGVPFGIQVPKVPALRQLVRRGADASLSDVELADLLSEALSQVEAGAVTQEELERLASAHVRIKGQYSLDRIVERTGAGAGLRSNLGDWVLALSELDPALATAVRALLMTLPPTTTGDHALAFLREIWNECPAQVEGLRRHTAPAYRYVLDDGEQDATLNKAWKNARSHIRLYGGRSWHLLGPELAVDDVQSPLLRRYLPSDRVIIASAHLGDTPEQVRRVAYALGLGFLSEEVVVRRGKPVGSPPYLKNLHRVLNLLGALEGRSPLTGIAVCESLILCIGGGEHPIGAYIDSGELVVVDDPRVFAVEAAGQLVEHFQLSQRGTDVAWLTGALFCLGSPPDFERNVGVLADGLGLDLEAEPASPPDSEEQRPDTDTADGDRPTEERADDAAEMVDSVVRPPAAEDSSGATEGEPEHARLAKGASRQPASPVASARTHDGKRAHSDGGSSAAKQSSGKTAGPDGGRAADHFRMLLVSRSREDGQPSEAVPGQRKDDYKAREAVERYEIGRGRRPVAADDNQPGYDVLSEDPSTHERRHIEVKGVQGKFEEDASVVLTSRQVHDALCQRADDSEYWLYVVDSTETPRPRVFPIPWTRYRTHLRYGFYACAWASDADQPAVVTETGLAELTAAPLSPLDPGDLDEHWDDDDEQEESCHPPSA